MKQIITLIIFIASSLLCKSQFKFTVLDNAVLKTKGSNINTFPLQNGNYIIGDFISAGNANHLKNIYLTNNKLEIQKDENYIGGFGQKPKAPNCGIYKIGDKLYNLNFKNKDEFQFDFSEINETSLQISENPVLSIKAPFSDTYFYNANFYDITYSKDSNYIAIMTNEYKNKEAKKEDKNIYDITVFDKNFKVAWTQKITINKNYNISKINLYQDKCIVAKAFKKTDVLNNDYYKVYIATPTLSKEIEINTLQDIINLKTTTMQNKIQLIYVCAGKETIDGLFIDEYSITDLTKIDSFKANFSKKYPEDFKVDIESISERNDEAIDIFMRVSKQKNWKTHMKGFHSSTVNLSNGTSISSSDLTAEYFKDFEIVSLTKEGIKNNMIACNKDDVANKFKLDFEYNDEINTFKTGNVNYTAIYFKGIDRLMLANFNDKNELILKQSTINLKKNDKISLEEIIPISANKILLHFMPWVSLTSSNSDNVHFAELEW